MKSILALIRKLPRGEQRKFWEGSWFADNPEVAWQPPPVRAYDAHWYPRVCRKCGRSAGCS